MGSTSWLPKTKFALALGALVLVACSQPEPSPKPSSEPADQDAAASAEPLSATLANTSYPGTREGDVIDTYFGTEVPDPYRWLEDDMSDETAEWVTDQNKVTGGYLERIPYRNRIKNRLEALWNYEKESAPFREGNYTYFYRNNGLQNQDVLYRQTGDSEPEVFLDPNSFSEDGTTSLSSISFSKDGSLAAYAVSEGGSDWRKVFVIDVETIKQLEAPLADVKFSDMSWLGQQGFYYSSYDKPDGSELSAKTDQHKLYFHKVGTTQDSDQLVYGGNDAEKHRYIGGYVTDDDRYLTIQAAQSTSSNDLYLVDLKTKERKVVPVIEDVEADSYVIDNKGSQLFLVTNLDAPNQRVVTVDASKPDSSQWQDVIPETDQVLSPRTGGGYLFAEYMEAAISKVYQYNYEGKRLREIEMPGPGSANGFSGKADDTTLYYTFTNYMTPSTIYALNPATGESTIHRESSAKFDSSQYESNQVFYTSKDGTQIPMIITHKKGLKLNGENPTVLYGYGGFNISLTPRFSISNAVWMELGGVYAVPNLRGGGEFGKAWHKAGTLQQKQNVFDDFIAAAEYLIENKYTAKQYLAIRGGSNGGLLVGATMTQRPDLMQVALPAVGVMDMLRYHTFTAGAGWAYDYGTAEQSKEMFEYLRAYSPVHALKPDTEYPATLVTTGDHDDRVVPAHSFKFAATLQKLQAADAPTLIRIETDAGHGAGTPLAKVVEQYADIFAFTLFNMGFDSISE